MANSKQKPAPEGTQRRPGKSKFSIPRREAPPVDGSYLDRLFADYEKQSRELEEQPTEVLQPEEEVAEHQLVTGTEQPVPAETAAPLHVVETSAAEVLESRPIVVPVPSQLRQSVTTEPEEPAALSSPADTSDVADATSVRPAASEVSQIRQASTAISESADDEALLERWKKRHRLSKGEVKVLRVMVSMCREADGDHCYVKIPQLMASAELKERQTQLVLRSLKELGLVEKMAEYSNADRMGTKYRVAFDSE